MRGIDRMLETLSTEEERPIHPDLRRRSWKMLRRADCRGMGADIVDANMGCPSQIAKHNAGCSLMRELAHAASVIAAMAKAVKIPVTVKMRAGWSDDERNAPTLAKMVQDAGAAAIAGPRPTAAQSYSGFADWDPSPRSRRPDDSGLRRATASSRSRWWRACRRAWRACWSAAAAAQPVDPRAADGPGRRARAARDARGPRPLRSTTSSCCSTSVFAIPSPPVSATRRRCPWGAPHSARRTQLMTNG